MGRLGVTTVECKSGYGLSTEQELKLLEIYRELGQTQPLTIVPTFLGAHIVPQEYKKNRRLYIDLLINEMLPAVCERNLARFCDIFIEDTAFSTEEAREILNVAVKLGLKIKVHADQFGDNSGSLLAADLHAVSADHLEFISDGGISCLAQNSVVGVILPIASLYTRQKAVDARRLIDKKLKLAVATDFNPGSAPSFDLYLALMLACNLCGLTPAEAVKGATIYAAEALDLSDRLGSLEPGKLAVLLLLILLMSIIGFIISGLTPACWP